MNGGRGRDSNWMIEIASNKKIVNIFVGSMDPFIFTSFQIVRRGESRSEEGEKAVAVSYIRRRVSVAAVKGQCISLLGRLEVLGPGTAAAAGRIRWAQVQEQRWRKDRQAMLLNERQGRSILRRGFAILD